MDLNFTFFLNSILLGVGLAMDAFSVSMANGLKEPLMKKGKMSIVAGVYSLFQFLMPLIGYLCIHTIATYFKGFTYAIPFIALILLSYIGIKMIVEGVKNKDNVDSGEHKILSFKVLLLQGIATSIDALSVGFTIADYKLIAAIICSIIIALVTFILCFIGIIIGKKIGTKLSNKADILGGIILLGIGIEIFVTGIIDLFF